MYSARDINQDANTATFDFADGGFRRRWFAIPAPSGRVIFVTSLHHESGIPKVFKDRSFETVADAVKAVLALNAPPAAAVIVCQ